MPIFYRSCLYEKRKYDYLLQDYPNYLTKEDFYKIAHISKATARYLLQSGKVPCKDTGKKTHRYLIPTENAIRYLEDREIHLNEYAAEPGWYSGKVKHGKKGGDPKSASRRSTPQGTNSRSLPMPNWKSLRIYLTSMTSAD